MTPPELPAAPPEPGWWAVKEAVSAVLDQPTDRRRSHLESLCSDPAERAAVARLLAACERAASSPILDLPAAHLAAPVVAEVGEVDDAFPDDLRAALAGRYTIDREVGRGGMGRVYLAHDERHGRPVALKLLSQGFLPDHGPSGGAARFQREIEIAARLAHPHILPLFDSGAAEGLLYYITPYVDGETLRDRLARTGPLPLAESVRVLGEVARALAHAHRRGVVHCDVKPANILLNAEGDALVADFGVARALAEAQGQPAQPSDPGDRPVVLGTPAYMAPEQVTDNAAVDHRADLYALGAVAYELLTGTPPFAGRKGRNGPVADTGELRDTATATWQGVPPALVKLVERLLAPRPEDRPEDAEEVLQVLSSVLERGRTHGRGARRRSLPLLVGGLILLPLAWFAAPWRQTTPSAGLGEGASVAVLSFAGTTGSLDDAAIGEGLTDALTRRLRGVPGLRVAGRASVAALERRDLDVQTIGDTLDVATVMVGTVLRDDDRVRVDARLLRARDRRALWSERYDVPAEDLLTLREQVAQDVVAAMSAAAGWDRLPAGLAERDTRDPAAYELYLKGRYLTNTRQRDGLFRAVQYFDEAIQRDPAYARAYAGSADAWTFLGIFNHVPPHEGLSRARTAAERAIALDSLLVEAHASLAHLLFVYEWNWPAAEAALEHAIALDPRYPLLRMYYASFLHSVGRSEEALEQLAVARELDPLTPTGVFSGRIYADTHRPDSAIRILQEEIELEPRLDLAHQILAHAYLQKGMDEEAIASMERAAALSGPRDQAQLAYVYARTGDHAEARRIVAGLLAGDGPLDQLGFHLAMAYAGLGEPDEAFRWLEAAYVQHASFMNLVGVATGLETLRSDPRYENLLRRMGLR